MKASSFSHYLGTSLLALGATMLQASTVNAAEASAAPGQQTVRVGDLDLSRSEDVAKLYRRIRAAAENVCGDAVVSGSRLPTAVHTRCVTETVERTVLHLNDARLSAYHRQETADANEVRRRGA